MLVKPIFLLLSCYFCSGLNSKDFCRLVETEAVGQYDRNNKFEVVQRLEKCSKRNKPHIYQCDENLCTKNKAECNKYLSLKRKFKNESQRSFVDIKFMSVLADPFDYKIEEEIQKFKSQVKNCLKAPFHRQANEICAREKKCLQIKVIFFRLRIFKLKKIKKINYIACPCLVTHTNV
jgi:hypothetical protein